MVTTAPYGSWRSPLSAAHVASAEIRLGQPCLDGADACWLERRPTEGGRSVLVRRTPDGRLRELTPAPFNVRTLVHEYGGGDYAVQGGLALAVSYADQRVWRLGETPTALTPESGGRLRYADLQIDRAGRRVIAVREEHGGGEPRNVLVALDLDREGPGAVLFEDTDFVSSPRISPDGRQLAWLSWNHPNMPWDRTSLHVAEVTDSGLGEARVIGETEESLVEPAWSPGNVLHVVSDRSGFWNLYRLEGEGLRPLCPMEADFAGPAWTFGASWYGFLGEEDLLCCYTRDGFWHLGRLDALGGRLRTYDLPYASLGGLRTADGRAILRVAAPDHPAAIALFEPLLGEVEVLREAGDLPVDPGYLSKPQPVRFATEDGALGHAFYYPPTNPDFAAPDGERPPLIVHSHGGPTGAAGAGLDLETQFWTSRGFAVVDVNYGGSTGFGRAYRKRLEGRWGEVDVADCVAAVRHLISEDLADAAHIAISGGSAGGFTTLAALTFTHVFKVGASHYGIGDLEALARDTHKFESRYLDRLVGPYPEQKRLYVARSPIHHTERLSCPVIFFQGLEDTIVPPNQAERMVEALRAKKLPVCYLAFEGEQHGFRKAATIVRVLEAQLAFFCRVLAIHPADDLPEIPIENM